MNLRILIVDDHEVVRSGLAGIINRQPGMSVVGEAADGETAIALFRQLRPDVVLMDLKLPRLSGWEATARIRSEFPSSRVLVLTTLEGDEDIQRALKAGALGYLLKDTPTQQLVTAIKNTERELEVLNLIVAGKSNKEIASDFNVSESTIKGHVSNLISKLGASDRTSAVTIALRRGLVNLDQTPNSDREIQ